MTLFQGISARFQTFLSKNSNRFHFIRLPRISGIFSPLFHILEIQQVSDFLFSHTVCPLFMNVCITQTVYMYLCSLKYFTCNNNTNSLNVPFLEVRIAAEASSFQEGFHNKEPGKVHHLLQ